MLVDVLEAGPLDVGILDVETMVDDVLEDDMLEVPVDEGRVDGGDGAVEVTLDGGPLGVEDALVDNVEAKVLVFVDLLEELAD